MAGQTLAFWRGVAEREKLCATCPDEGGACEKHMCCLEPGQRLVWNDRLATSATCLKWPEFELRTRIQATGIPKRLLGSTMQRFRASADASEKHLTKLGQNFTELLQQKKPPSWVVVVDADGGRKTEFFAAYVRVLLREQIVRPVYVNTPSFRDTLRAFFKSKGEEEDPREPLINRELLILDELPARAPAWLKQELESILRERWDACKATLIGTREETKLLGAAYPSLVGFVSSVTECKLAPKAK